MCRARLILDFEGAMGKRDVTEEERHHFFPAYLHVLRPVDQKTLHEAFDVDEGGDEGLKQVLRFWPPGARIGSTVAQLTSN